jgi:hypothetical protein
LPELSPAARRSILLTLFLALGALAAALPALLGEPQAEHAALRGLTAGLFALAAALVLVTRWGSRGALPTRAHGLELGQLAAVLAAVLLPALFAGVTSAEVRALATLAQSKVGWKEPVSPFLLSCFVLLVTYTMARLKSSVREERLAGRSAVSSSILVFLVLSSAAVRRLAQIPAPAAIEKLEKWALLGILLTLGAAALVAGRRRGRVRDGRALALVTGFFCLGPSLSFAAYSYLRPAVDDIERILVTHGTAQGTTFAAALEGRPDLYGLFSLEYASASPRLELVRPMGASIDFLIEKTASTALGRARLEPRPEPQRRWSELRPPPVEDSFVEVWIRFRSWPWLDLRPGLRFREPVFDWAVSPSGAVAIASTYVPSPGAWPNIRYDQMDRGTYAVDLYRAGRAARRLVDDLPLPPRIVELTERSAHLMIHGQSYSRGRLRTVEAVPRQHRDDGRSRDRARAEGFVLATSYVPAPTILGVTTCDLSSMECSPWQVGAGPRRRSVPARERLVLQSHSSWSIIDSRTLAVVFQPPRCPACSGDSDRGHLLRGGVVLRLTLLGRMPNWESRLSAFDPAGRALAVTSLGNVRQTRFAGELDDGTVAILWRSHYAYGSLTEPVFGWTLDSWNPATGKRQRLADDLATFPSSENDASMIFLDRRGRLVVPAVGGVRALADLE